MRYGLAIFDFDGTLADSFPWFLEILGELAERHRFRRMGGDEVEALRGLDARRILRELEVPAWRLPLIARDFRSRMTGEIDRIALFPGVAEMLRRLTDSGVELAIVTSNSADNVRRVLGPELVGRVRHLGCGASLFGKRPKIRAVVERSGVVPDRVLCVGDEIRDLQAAHALGLDFGAVAWGYTRAESLEAHAPRVLFRTPHEIVERILSREP